MLTCIWFGSLSQLSEGRDQVSFVKHWRIIQLLWSVFRLSGPRFTEKTLRKNLARTNKRTSHKITARLKSGNDNKSAISIWRLFSPARNVQNDLPIIQDGEIQNMSG